MPRCGIKTVFTEYIQEISGKKGFVFLMHSTEVRQKFLDFFQERDHAVRPSSPLIPPPDDPTLLFTTAGMLQFKPLWAGAEVPFTRAATVQKCLRAGGKGSDLENVGRTLRHHTFFEMLGNFSFGDYFKKEAIAWAWEFVVQAVKLPRENLWVSIYLDDEEAFSIWCKKIGVPEERIVRLGDKDNFWGPAGATGACGPCSEIYFDLGPERGCGQPGCKPGCDCERYIEFWNLVFPQFYQQEDGSRGPLERRGIDTGMGLERLVFLLQSDAKNNYETDLFQPIIVALKGLTSVPYQDENKPSFHVIADHVRALTFSLSENILPANEGRGYVLRRLLRRAVRQGRKIGITEPFLHKLVDQVVEIMRSPYPQLVEAKEQVTRVILMEEERFQHTLDYGLYMLEEIIAGLQKQKKKQVAGNDIFKLYDTYGFPLDIMQEVVSERDLTLDYAGFEKLMDKQKERARKSWVGAEKAEVSPVYQKIQKENGEQKFLGYEELKAKTNILALVRREKREKKITQGQEGEMFIAETPFYAEAGGQVGDTGLIVSSHGEVEVIDTRRILPGVIAHRVRVKKGEFSPQEEVEAVVDSERRLAIARHHTATHLLQYCLRETLGDHVKQCGSLVNPDKLRFDFTHFAAIEADERQRIQDLVNAKVLEDARVNTYTLSLQAALAKGVLAFFGEKYGEEVRVLDIGGYSKELCGGTHVHATGQIGLFRITSEGSISSGVRRIEAVCGKVSVQLAGEEERILKEISSLLKTEPEKATGRLKELLQEQRVLTKQKEQSAQQDLCSQAETILTQVKTAGGIKIIAANTGAVRVDHLRMLGDLLKDKLKSGVIVLGAPQKDKVALLIVVTKDLVAKGYHAGKLVKEVAALVGGSGGGRPDMAQAGGKKPELLDKALTQVPVFLTNK